MDTHIKKRKSGHLQICLEKNVNFNISTGFEKYKFIHNALPEINKNDIDLSGKFLGRRINYPVMISAMTGGNGFAKKININLARAAQKLKIPMTLGSARIAIECPDTIDTFDVRRYAPDIPLIANLGAVQLNYCINSDECCDIIEKLDADALTLHLNPLQEALQPFGDINFKGLLQKIKKLRNHLQVPLIIKEVGFGISLSVAERLKKIGIKIIDVAGAGGTSWAAVENYNNPLGKEFWDWGIKTEEAIKAVRKLKGIKIIASGGIRSGSDIAKSIALGAELASIGLPLLKPATKSPECVVKTMKNYLDELEIIMFCIGANDNSELKNTKNFFKSVH